MLNKQIILEIRCFHKRLKLLGFKDYGDYLKSEHWKNKKIEYAKSELPKECLCCGDKKYNLHHRSYVRIGDESLFDFIPLCKICHKKIHTYMKERNICLSATHRAIKEVFGFTRKQTRDMFRKVAKKGVFKFKDSTKVDILKYDRLQKKHIC